MKTGFWRRASLAGLVYLLAFVGLVLLQYSSSSGVSWKAGIVSLHGSLPNARAATPASFDLSIDGLHLLVDPKHPAQALRDDGSRAPLSLLGIDRVDNGARVRFDGLVLAMGLEGGSVRISVSSSDPSVRFLELANPVPPAQAWTLGDHASRFSAQGRDWRVSLPATAFVDSAVDFSSGSTVLVEAVNAPTPGKVTYVAKSDVDFRQSILAWLDKAWSGLDATRRVSGAYKWKMADGSRVFSEDALAAWLAESFRRGQGEAALVKARQARDSFAASLTWKTVPYFGDTMSQMARLEASDVKDSRTFALQVSGKDPSILETPNLISRLVDRSPRGFSSEVIAFLATLDPAALTLRQRIGLLEAAASAGSLLRSSADPLPNHVAAENLVLAGIVQAGSSWFLKSSDDGSVDVSLSLDAGLALVSLGKTEGKDNLLAAGQALVDGALALSDAEGFIPATIVVTAGDIASKDGMIAPESLYGRIADNPWYPHETSFARDLEPGIWAWTCSPNLTVEAATGKRTFSSTFPVGLAHYLVIYGISKFSNIKLYGIDYSPDSQFESYNVSGYYYRGSIGALYLKMRHKTEVEKIELDY